MTGIEVLALGMREGTAPFSHPEDVFVREVARRSVATATAVRRVVRANSPSDLLNKLSCLGIPIHRLDLVFHGAQGLMDFGRAEASNRTYRLFESGSDLAVVGGVAIARKLRKLLTPTAQVRLLGCNTGVDREGRMLVYKVGCELGQDRVVFGMIRKIGSDDFDERGWFQRDDLLFSSLAALDTDAPGHDHRRIYKPSYTPTPDDGPNPISS